MKKNGCHIILILACAISCTNEYITVPEEKSNYVYSVSIDSDSIIYSDGYEDDDDETRHLLQIGSYSSSGSFDPWFNKVDTLGIFPATGDQIPFPLSDLTVDSTQSFTFYGKGWDLKDDIYYYSYFPFARCNYKDSININHIEYDYLGQVIDSTILFQNPSQKIKVRNSKYWLQFTDPEIANTSGKIGFKYHHITCGYRLRLNFRDAFNSSVPAGVTIPDTVKLILTKIVFSDTTFTVRGTYNLKELASDWNTGDNKLHYQKWEKHTNGKEKKTNVLNVKINNVKIKKLGASTANNAYFLYYLPPHSILSGRTFKILVYDSEYNYYETTDQSYNIELPGGYLHHKAIGLKYGGKARPEDIKVEPWDEEDETINSNWNYK